MDFLVLVIARLFGPITSTIVFVCDIDLKFSSVFFRSLSNLRLPLAFGFATHGVGRVAVEGMQLSLEEGADEVSQQ